MLTRTTFRRKPDSARPRRDGKDQQPPAEKRRAQLQASAQRSLRRLQRLATTAAQVEGATTGWENEFIVDVSERLKTYGRAFADPEKGSLELALSVKQSFKVRQIAGSVKRRLKSK